ncbi:MAG: AMP-binding protein [Myxococcales bacterium]|nr:AMP-binding protein [Myxococcales bacterium]MDH3404910.1 AMP-binding protein [Acidobacteriota bacterium]
MTARPTIFERAAGDPGGPALDDLTRRRTWAELIDRAARIAHLLRDEFGLGPDDCAAVLMDNRVELVELTLGAIWAGIWLTPINGHLGSREIAAIVADSGARVLFCDERFEPTAREAGAPARIRTGDELDRALAAASDAPPDPAGPAGGTMIYTSGTTGRPKGVQRRRAPTLTDWLANTAAAGAALGLDGSGPHLVTGPLYHAAPLLFAIYDNANGAPIVIMPRWEEQHALELIREREVRHTHMVPTMFVRLLRLPPEVRERFSAPRLDLVLHGAAPISPGVKQRMIAWWGERLVEYWGGTEGGVCTLVDSADWLAHPGTVGRAVPAYEVFAVDEDGRRLPAGETGLLYARHRTRTQVFAYHRDPEKTARAHLEDGAFTLGDIGRVDGDGYVYLVDRRSHTIISGGVNIYPAEIEQVLQEHPAVADVAVFGIPDDEWGESVKAVVQLEPGPSPSPPLEAEILAFGRERLAAYKVPRSIDFEPALPRHPTGKLQVRQLRDRYWKDRDRRI